jgi:hypothetical protein
MPETKSRHNFGSFLAFTPSMFFKFLSYGMKSFTLLVFLSILTHLIQAQNAKDFTIGVQVDIVKSDYHGYFERVQAGIEANYFLSAKFSLTGGAEYWSEGSQFSGVAGARWYPVQDAFIRARGFFGANDISIGAGWVKPLKEHLRFEAIGDIYFDGQIAIRGGLSYTFPRKINP